MASLGGQAEALLAMKQPAQAVQLLQAAAAKRPDEPALRNLLGATAMKAGQPGVAVAEFSALAAKIPKSVEAKLALAQAHQMERRLPDARQVLEAARQLAPADVRVLGQLGDVAAAKGDYSKALGVYREVAAQRPRDALVLNNIAYALVETNGDLNEAVAKSSEAVRLAP
ncbi:MAG: tetratricopeptide repeat protein, partial [Bryobacteraceae bacterium]|nr:tetratricopeptide repeat protein [Bryobacteraceae bacterium]